MPSCIVVLVAVCAAEGSEEELREVKRGVPGGVKESTDTGYSRHVRVAGSDREGRERDSSERSSESTARVQVLGHVAATTVICPSSDSRLVLAHSQLGG